MDETSQRPFRLAVPGSIIPSAVLNIAVNKLIFMRALQPCNSSVLLQGCFLRNSTIAPAIGRL